MKKHILIKLVKNIFISVDKKYCRPLDINYLSQETIPKQKEYLYLSQNINLGIL